MLWLLNTDGFVPRWSCGDWCSGLGCVSIVAQLTIAFVYLCIPYLLLTAAKKRPDLPYRTQARLFAAFVACCAVGHLVNVLIFWLPLYRLLTAWDVLTAVVSFAALRRLQPVIPQLVAMRSPQELQDEINHRTQVEKDLRHTNRNLQNEITLRKELEARIRQLEACHHAPNGESPTQAAIARMNVATQAVASALPPAGAPFEEDDTEEYVSMRCGQ